MTLTHRRLTDKLTRQWVMLFSEDGENSHYGHHVWRLCTQLPHVRDDHRVLKYAMEYYAIDEETALGLIDPEDIIGDAGVWDDPQFVSDLWQELEPIGYRTNDGAVVLDREQVVLEYYYNNYHGGDDDESM